MAVSDPVQPIAPSARGRPLRRALVCVLALLAGLWCWGAVLFLRADGVTSLTLPRRETPPAAEHNVASYRWGPTVRASSYYRDLTAHHHPMFLVDERPMPTLIDKWASAPRDRSPWIEILWREPRNVARVVIQHAGTREDPAVNVRSYTLRCLTAHGVGPVLQVKDNAESLAVHKLSCPDALGLHIDWTLSENLDVARVYEVEVWAR